MTTTTIPTEVTHFAEQVRAELADLSAEDLDDLTDGLEADLAESLEEDPTRRLPDPVAYASELRTAAGLPVRSEPARGIGGAIRGMTSGLRSTGHQVAESLRGHPVTAGMLGFLEALRPIWWVLRAWVAYWLVAAFFGSEAGFAPAGLWWLVLLAFVVVSVQLGRGRWRAKGVPTLVIVGNVIAAIVVVPVVASAASWTRASEIMYVADPEPARGLTLNDRPVTNVFVYGADGKPLKDVQLFDQDGAPLEPYAMPEGSGCVDVDCSEDGGMAPKPRALDAGEDRLNVYPLQMQRMIYDELGELVPDPTFQQAQKPPFVQVPRLDRAEKGD